MSALNSKIFWASLLLAGELSADCGNWDISADFLVWFASEDSTSYWANAIGTKVSSEGIADTFIAKKVSFDWDYGFRIGAGYHFDYDEWDSQVYWTWFRTDADSHIPKDSLLVLTEFFNGFINGDNANRGKMSWSILYNMIDWELGRNFCVCDSLFLRPFVGVKGGWIYQSLHSQFQTAIFLAERI